MNGAASSRDQVLPELTELIRIGLALSNEKDLATLLEMIVTTARTLTRADAGTLYIVEHTLRQLRFNIIQNDTTKTYINAVRDASSPIPPPVPLFIDGAPNNGNVSSYVGLTGETVNIADVYAAKGFNFTGVKNYDEVSGYHSKSMLVIPMKDHEGLIIGVLQLLNARAPKDGSVVSFSERDAVLVGSLASQAAVALTNTTLLGRMNADLEEIRRLHDSEKELGDKLRDAYIRAEQSNQELKEALAKVWVVRLTGAIFLILIAAIFWFSSGQAGSLQTFTDLGRLITRKAAPEAASQSADIPTTGVEITQVSTSITLVGQVEPVQQINVVSPFSGKIAEVSFVYGQVVQEGDVLAEIDPGEMMVRLREAQAAVIRTEQNEKMLRNWLSGPEVTRAKMNQSRSRATLDSLKRKLAEARVMFSRGIIPKTELESAQESHDNQVVNDQAAADEVRSLSERCSPENLRIASMEVKNARVRRDELQSQIDRSVVRAPLSGVVLRPTAREDERRGGEARPIERGSPVEQGQALVAIGNLEGIMVRSQVDEVNISRIAPGQQAWVTGDAFPGLMLPGSITTVSCQARASEGGRADGGKPPSFDVTVTVPQLDDTARAIVRVGMSASAMVTTYENPEAMVLPVSAVMAEPDGYFVFRRDPATGRFEKTSITAGSTTLDSVEVLEGITASDAVALSVERFLPLTADRPPSSEVIRLEGITKSFRIGVLDMPILKGIDLSVGKGELTAIVGTSGGGKSTLMNIIGLLDEPTAGAYFLEGENVLNIDDDRLSEIRARKIGFVFQQFNLLPRSTALENVALPLIYRGVSRREGQARAMAMLEKVGMQDRAQHRPAELSGGQQQRVAVARALVGNPSLILADEPTGALDTRVAQEIMDLFARLNRDDGITVVVITHDLAMATQCRRQVRIRDGQILDESAGGAACS